MMCRHAELVIGRVTGLDTTGKVATVDVSALRRQMDTLAQQRRELDLAIQGTNWATELAE